MTVFIYGQIYPDSFARNIAETLRAMGHRVVSSHHPAMNVGTRRGFTLRYKALTYATRLLPGIEKAAQESLLKTAVAVKPDLVIVAGEQVHPAVIRRLKERLATRVVYWMSDALTSFGRQYALAADYDVLFFKDQYIVEFVRSKLGKRAHFLPQAFNPRWHRPIELAAEDRRRYGCDLTVAGNLYWYRALMLEPFVDYDFKMWGTNVPRWLESPARGLHQGRYVAEEEKAKAFRAAKIVLNTMHYAEIRGVNARTFEAAGCGAFQIVDWRENMARFFEPEQEIVTFRCADELKEKVDYYLGHDGERRAIASRARARAEREHAYDHRLARLLAVTFDRAPDEG